MPKLNQRDFNDEPVKYVTEKHVACVFYWIRQVQ